MRKMLAVLLAFSVLTLFALTVTAGSTDNSPPSAVVAVVHMAAAVEPQSEPVFYWLNADTAEVATAQIKMKTNMHGARCAPVQPFDAARPEIVKRI